MTRFCRARGLGFVTGEPPLVLRGTDAGLAAERLRSVTGPWLSRFDPPDDCGR
jgi:hypothetical protein